MEVLMVVAHPLGDSLTEHIADHTAARLAARGHSVRRRNLYAEGFDPVLGADERRAYYGDGFEDRAGLQQAQALVLVFPTWWFGMPAILKGWIDRSFLPGVAFDHTPGGGPMIPRLHDLRQVLALTTLGSPWWVDRLVLRRPVARVLKWGVVRPCAPKARVRVLPLYAAEQVAPARLVSHLARIERVIDRDFA